MLDYMLLCLVDNTAKQDAAQLDLHEITYRLKKFVGNFMNIYGLSFLLHSMEVRFVFWMLNFPLTRWLNLCDP